MKYSIIYADPPWFFKAGIPNGSSKGALQHYDCMTKNELLSLNIKSLAAPDCALFMWTTSPHFPESLDVLKAWGFEYKTVAFVWVKELKDGRPLESGLGYWTRSGAEYCILGTRGRPKRVNASVPQLVFSPRSEHSVKPAIVYTRIEELMGPLDRIELFSRRAMPGWDRHGSDKGDIRDFVGTLYQSKITYECDVCGKRSTFLHTEGMTQYCPSCGVTYDLP